MSALAGLVERGLVARDWAEALAPADDALAAALQFLREEAAAGRAYLPEEHRVLRAFERPLAEARVLVVGQDPYPTPGHAVGLAFAVERGVSPLPPSLRNLQRELHDDLGHPPVGHGDLTAWADRGVVLLNRCLTVRPGEPGSHRGRGWEEVTACAVGALAGRAAAGQPLVALLWGADARALAPALAPVRCLVAPHPSPLSAYRGFFGSRPFSQADAELVAQGGEPVDWRLPA